MRQPAGAPARHIAEGAAASRRSAKGASATRDVVLVKPRTYVNNSGHAVSAAVKSMKVAPQNVLVVYDELDLPMGRLRLKAKGGDGGPQRHPLDRRGAGLDGLPADAHRHRQAVMSTANRRGSRTSSRCGC